MPMVLMAQATKPEQLQQLQTTYPDWTFKDAAAVTAADYDQIEVMYGNHPLLKTILARPINQLKFVQVISAGVDYCKRPGWWLRTRVVFTPMRLVNRS